VHAWSKDFATCLCFLAGIGGVSWSEHHRTHLNDTDSQQHFSIENHVWDFGLTAWDNCMMGNNETFLKYEIFI
jgi:hypothetical protein